MHVGDAPLCRVKGFGFTLGYCRLNEGHDSGYHQNHQDGSRVVSAEMHGCLCWQSAGPEPECEHIRTGAHSSEPQSGASAAH